MGGNSAAPVLDICVPSFQHESSQMHREQLQKGRVGGVNTFASLFNSQAT